MSDFDSEKKDGQARPDYYQPNQNAGGTYYNPPQNDQAHDSKTMILKQLIIIQSQIIINRQALIITSHRKMTIIHKMKIHQSRQRKIRPVK